jgi:hypothetical protein
MDQYRISEVDAPAVIDIGHVDGVSPRASAVDDSRTHAVVIVQIAAGGHHAVAAVTEYVVACCPRSEVTAILPDALHNGAALVVHLARLEALHIRPQRVREVVCLALVMGASDDDRHVQRPVSAHLDGRGSQRAGLGCIPGTISPNMCALTSPDNHLCARPDCRMLFSAFWSVF